MPSAKKEACSSSSHTDMTNDYKDNSKQLNVISHGATAPCCQTGRKPAAATAMRFSLWHPNVVQHPTCQTEVTLQEPAAQLLPPQCLHASLPQQLLKTTCAHVKPTGNKLNQRRTAKCAVCCTHLGHVLHRQRLSSECFVTCQGRSSSKDVHVLCNTCSSSSRSVIRCTFTFVHAARSCRRTPKQCQQTTKQRPSNACAHT